MYNTQDTLNFNPNQYQDPVFGTDWMTPPSPMMQEIPADNEFMQIVPDVIESGTIVQEPVNPMPPIVTTEPGGTIQAEGEGTQVVVTEEPKEDGNKKLLLIGGAALLLYFMFKD